MANHGKTALALFAGLAAGAALGVLFAPRSGRETRAAIRGKGEELKEELDERIEEARKEWNKAKGRMNDAASMSKDDVNDFVHYMFSRGKKAAERVKDEVKDGAQDIADKGRRTAEEHQRAARSN